MDGSSVLLVVVGVVLLALTALTRSSASAGYWGGRDGQERLVVVGLPCLGAVLVLAGLMPALPQAARPLVGALVLLLCLVVLGWAAFGLPLPGWAVPAHLRARRAARIAAETAARRRTGKGARRG